MDLRVLEYFLAVAREGNITNAAESLHLTQPTLSRQLKDLEDELGKQLLIRGKRQVTLTKEGMLMRKRAEELTGLAKKTIREIMDADDSIHGDLYIGAGETRQFHYVTRVAKQLQDVHPCISFHISSGDTNDITEQLDNGLIDFGLLFDSIDETKYDCIPIPLQDIWGVLMRKDSFLAEKSEIAPDDLTDYPLILQRSMQPSKLLSGWFGDRSSSLNVVGTYSLAYNASIMVSDGIGYALCIDGIINTSTDSEFCFRPLVPKLESKLNIVWKKYQLLSRPASLFIEKLKESYAID